MSVPIVYGLPGPGLESDTQAGKIVLGGCDVARGQDTRACSACGHRWANNVDCLDAADLVEELGRDFVLWHCGDLAGAFLDWEGWPLVLKFKTTGIAVEAEVGQGGDYAPEDEDLDVIIDVPLGGTELLYRDDLELAWLRRVDQGDLARTCDQVATLAPAVSRALSDRLFFDPKPASYEELDARGPIV